jgi:hypothetical protein
MRIAPGVRARAARPPAGFGRFARVRAALVRSGLVGAGFGRAGRAAAFVRDPLSRATFVIRRTRS